MKQKLTRTELYDLVWSTPLSTLAKRYGISYDHLRKTCKKVDVPIPKTGHWQRVKHGKPPIATPLSINDSAEQSVELGMNSADPRDIPLVVDEVKAHQQRVEIELRDLLNIPQKLINPDRLTQATMRRFAESARDDWHVGYSSNAEELSVSASKPLRQRALRIFDTLIKALRFRGHGIKAGYRAT
jgi:hypothetical protein